MYPHRIEYLESLQAKQELTKQLVDRAKMVAVGGIDGIRIAAQTDPELIILAITLLAQTVEMSFETEKEMAEDYFKLLDRIDKLESRQ